MCVRERYTARRGRAALPLTFSRTRAWRRMRPTSRAFPVVIALLPLRLRADLASLAGLLAQDLAGVLHALVLVRVRDAQPADLRGHLADGLLVDTGDLQLLRRLRGEGDAGRRLDLDRVAEAEVERQLLPLDDGAETRAVDLEIARVAGRHALDHVREERPREPVQRARGLLVVLAGHDDRAVLALHRDVRVERLRELALRALHLHGAAVDLHVDALRHLEWQSSDPTHLFPTRYRRGLPRPVLSARPRGRS